MKRGTVLLVLALLLIGCVGQAPRPTSEPTEKLDDVKCLTMLRSPGIITVGRREKFTSSWFVRNCGTTIWADYVLVPINELGPVRLESYDIPSVQPGDTGTITATFVAPAQSGTFVLYVMLGRYQDELFREVLEATVSVH